MGPYPRRFLTLVRRHPTGGQPLQSLKRTPHARRDRQTESSAPCRARSGSGNCCSFEVLHGGRSISNQTTFPGGSGHSPPAGDPVDISNRYGSACETGSEPTPDNAWSIHIEGAAGEMAAAKALGRYWAMPVNTFKADGDVGELQIRTGPRHHNEFIVRPGDRDSDTFVLVTGRSPRFRVHGYIIGGQAKRSAWTARSAKTSCCTPT
jgi:hypothetical protein